MSGLHTKLLQIYLRSSHYLSHVFLEQSERKNINFTEQYKYLTYCCCLLPYSLIVDIFPLETNRK